MKKFSFVVVLFFISVFSFAEIQKKEIIIDNLYKVEQSFDSETNELMLKLFSDNDVPFDELYAENNFEEILSDFSNEHSFDGKRRTKDSIDYEYEGKYTVIERKYVFYGGSADSN